MKHFRDSWNEFQRHISLPPAYQGGREIQGLQILKFFCALMVVEIHFHSALHTMLNPLDRIAVPVFFMISGYFLPDAQGCISPARIERVFWKILRLTFWVNAIYFAYCFFGSIWDPSMILTIPIFFVGIRRIERGWVFRGNGKAIPLDFPNNEMQGCVHVLRGIPKVWRGRLS